MIDSILVKNFQCYRDAELEFSKGINIIIGESESGKTAILRALHWLKDNEPLGFGFLKTGEESCSVTVVKGKIGIQRFRNKNTNTYTIQRDIKKSYVEDSLFFEAMKGAVPKDVVDILNLSDINIQDQFDQFYLVLDSPGNIAKVIGEVIGLDEADRLISNVNRDVKNVKFFIEERKDDLKKLEEELKKFDYLDEFENLLESYESQQGRVVRLEKEVSELDGLLSDYAEVEDKKKDLIIINENEKRLISEIRFLRRLQGLVDIYKQREEEISKIIVLTEKEKWMVEQISEVDEMDRLLQNYSIVEGEVGEIRKHLTACKEIRGNLLESIDCCPVCEQEVLGESKKKVIDYYGEN